MKVDMEILKMLSTEMLEGDAGALDIKEFANTNEFQMMAVSALIGAKSVSPAVGEITAFTAIFGSFFYLGCKYAKAQAEVDTLEKSFKAEG